MSKNTNLSFLTDYITADITNGRIGINNASPAYAFDVTGIARTSTSTYLATASGNVGIGTTSPADFIDATSGVAIIAPSGRSGLSLGSTQGTADEILARLSFTNTNSTNAGSKRLSYISGIRGTTNNSAYLEFGTANDGLGTQRMVISQTGNVGIGTSSPVGASSDDLVTQIYNSVGGGSASRAMIRLTNSFSGSTWGNGSWMSIDSSLDFYIANSESASMIFQTSGTERMRITSGGSLLMTKDNAIGINTSDGSDNGYLALCGAGDGGENRGGHIYLSGNERSADPGSVVISAGNVIGTGSFIFFRTAGTEKVRIVGSGNVIIGSTSDNGYKLQVTGSIYATGSIVANSDIILKKNILKIENALEKIKQISGYTYEFKADDSKRHAGVIAQEIQKVLPEIVNKGDDGILGVEYGNMSALLIEAIKELSEEITILKNK